MHPHRGFASQASELRAVRRLVRFSISFALLAMALLFASPVQASTLEIQVSGLDLQYDGTNIFDAGVHNTIGIGDPAQSDGLSLLEFYVDGNLVGSQNTDVFADLYVKDVLNVPASGGGVVSAGNGDAFGIDL
jgi:hypothetical protein